MEEELAAQRQQTEPALAPVEPDDLQLLERIVAKDKEALDLLYTRYMTPVYALSLHMLKQPPLAEEVTQDVFLNIWLKAESFNASRGNPRSWIMSVTHHRVIDVIRSRRRSDTMTDPEGYDTLERIPSLGPSVESPGNPEAGQGADSEGPGGPARQSIRGD